MQSDRTKRWYERQAQAEVAMKKRIRQKQRRMLRMSRTQSAPSPLKDASRRSSTRSHASKASTRSTRRSKMRVRHAPGGGARHVRRHGGSDSSWYARSACGRDGTEARAQVLDGLHCDVLHAARRKNDQGSRPEACQGARDARQDKVARAGRAVRVSENAVTSVSG